MPQSRVWRNPDPRIADIAAKGRKPKDDGPPAPPTQTLRLLSPHMLDAWTFTFQKNGRAKAQHDVRDVYNREEWGLVRRYTTSSQDAALHIEKLETLGWKEG